MPKKNVLRFEYKGRKVIVTRIRPTRFIYETSQESGYFPAENFEEAEKIIKDQIDKNDNSNGTGV